MTKTLRNPYFPQLPPEREIVQTLHDRVAAQRGTWAITRGPGEQYILTCVCGSLHVTSDMNAPSKFARNHAKCSIQGEVA